MKTLKKTYTPELKEEAVKLVLAQGLSIEQAAAHVSIPKGTLANWVVAAKRGPVGAAAPGSGSVAELEAENAKLRKQLAQAEMERDIVKKRRRTLRRSRCQVRVYKDDATRFSCLSRDAVVPGIGRLAQRLLRLASGQAIDSDAGRRPAENPDHGSASADPGDVWGTTHQA